MWVNTIALSDHYSNESRTLGNESFIKCIAHQLIHLVWLVNPIRIFRLQSFCLLLAFLLSRTCYSHYYIYTHIFFSNIFVFSFVHPRFSTFISIKYFCFYWTYNSGGWSRPSRRQNKGGKDVNAELLLHEKYYPIRICYCKRCETRLHNRSRGHVTNFQLAIGKFRFASCALFGNWAIAEGSCFRMLQSVASYFFFFFFNSFSLALQSGKIKSLFWLIPFCLYLNSLKTTIIEVCGWRLKVIIDYNVSSRRFSNSSCISCRQCKVSSGQLRESKEHEYSDYAILKERVLTLQQKHLN